VSGSWVRKGAVDAILNYVNPPATAIGQGSAVELPRPNVSPDTVSEIKAIADAISKSGGRFWQARHPPRYAAFNQMSSPRFPLSSKTITRPPRRPRSWRALSGSKYQHRASFCG
jgi:hypothetical protein